MKRINPDTGEIFKSGDVRKDGRISRSCLLEFRNSKVLFCARLSLKTSVLLACANNL